MESMPDPVGASVLVVSLPAAAMPLEFVLLLVSPPGSDTGGAT